MQCLNIAAAARARDCGKACRCAKCSSWPARSKNVRRVYYWGFHNNDPKQLFQSSLSYNQVHGDAAGGAAAFRGLPAQRRADLRCCAAGRCGMIVPWAHGFKSIKWLQRITLTNDYKANDTYADANNDPDSYLKTAAYLDDGPQTFKAGEPIVIRGTAMVGWSGLKRVEYWLRPDAGTHGKLADDDPAWQTAKWQPCRSNRRRTTGAAHLPRRRVAEGSLGLRSADRQAEGLAAALQRGPLERHAEGPGRREPTSSGSARVDLNGFAQPEPRPYQKSGQQ